MNANILSEPFLTAFENGASIDYRVNPNSGISDHAYIEKLGYHSKMHSDCSYTADGLQSFSLSSYGNWGCFYTYRSSDEEKRMFLDMCEKDIIRPWRIRIYIGDYTYDYSTENGWSRYSFKTKTRETCENPYHSLD